MRETTVYREGCGTHLGMLLHQANGEEPCGECRLGELVRRLEAEARTPCPKPGPLPPISSRYARQNRRVLAAALGVADRFDRKRR